MTIDEAKDYIREWCPYDRQEEIIEALSNSDEDCKWVSVNKRLPEEGGDYLTTVSFDIGAKEPVREVYKDYFCVLSQKWLNRDEDVIAWMPSPEPYNAESEG